MVCPDPIVLEGQPRGLGLGFPLYCVIDLRKMHVSTLEGSGSNIGKVSFSCCFFWEFYVGTAMVKAEFWRKPNDKGEINLLLSRDLYVGSTIVGFNILNVRVTGDWNYLVSTTHCTVTGKKHSVLLVVIYTYAWIMVGWVVWLGLNMLAMIGRFY